MLLEQHPEIQGLTAAEKRLLADELYESASQDDDSEVRPETALLLKERVAAYQANPEGVTDWNDLKKHVFGRDAN